MKIFIRLFILLAFLTAEVSAQKPPLDHSVYDGWKSLGSSSISEDGKWVVYEINPQQGDSWLYICNVVTGSKDSVFCGSGARIAPDSKYLVYSVKPTYSESRQARKKKLKDDQLPKSKLGISLLNNEKPTIINKVKSFSVAENGSYWMAYLLEKQTADKKENKQVADTAKGSRQVAPKGKKPPEPKGTELVLFNPVTGKEYRHSDVVEYVVSRDGKSIGFVQDYPDTTKTDNFRISVFDTKKESVTKIFEAKGTAKKLTADKKGDNYSFIFTSDTSKIKIFDLYYSKAFEAATKVVDSANPSMPAGWSVSENGSISFSEDASRIFFGTSEKPVKEPTDTLLADEKYKLDIWAWDDDLLQPMQKLQVSEEQKRTFMAVYHTDKKLMVQLGGKDLPSVRTVQKGNNDVAIGTSDLKYRIVSSWDQDYSDYYTVNVETGARNLVAEKSASRVQFSPSMKFMVYWNTADKAWMSLNLATGVRKNISGNISFPLYDTEWDTPSDPSPYGIEGWLDDEKHVFLKDKYDIWLTDLNGIEQPVNITNGYGRKMNITFSYQRLDPDAEFIGKKESLMLSSFNNANKEAGYYILKGVSAADPARLVEGKYSFTRSVSKAKKAEKIIWAKGSFEVCPELFVSNTDFTGSKKLSVTNPQQSKYNWGTVELVEWNSFDNTKLQGLLYKPENFDASKKYPMIVYFYEKSSDGLYSYMPPAPARSIINRVFAASNGYLVFVPDIPYEIGYPGKSCYNAVMSGTYAMLDKYPFIDREHLALDGQSWGGYQIAYLVTQTNLFACAYSGAAVVDMISAYGGIRWGTGMSRMFQYEHTQSRIGGTLWDKPLQFVENSPIFWMPRVNTPLLIMHNDADGAVPWYQGIEFITALRRLGKIAWMLSYNDDDHNLMKRPNMKDLAIRKMQFFDHYLKGAPMPYWMKNGLTQLEKGKKDGYELVGN
ncbi:MAG: prolyl oligopeptidase family serine peptidase [Bacteroidales bacterium]